MENIAHTFFASAIGQTGLKKISRLGMATLIVSANFPDIDLLWSFYSDISYIEHHRGITHSFFGILFQVFLVSYLMYFIGKKQEKNKSYDEKVEFKPLLILSSIGLLSHLFLDLLNDYGVQPFLPFNNLRLQSATIFIVDIWFWLILGGFTFLTINLTKKLSILFSIFTLLSLSLVFLVPDIPLFSKYFYLTGIIILILFKYSNYKLNLKLTSYFFFSLFSLYISYVSYTKNSAEEFFEKEKIKVLNNQDKYHHLSPRPANIFEWTFFAKNETKIFMGKTSLISKKTELLETYERNLSNNYVEKALNTHTGKVFMDFSPYIFAYLRKNDNCVKVFLRDARYVRTGENSWASKSITFCD